MYFTDLHLESIGLPSDLRERLEKDGRWIYSGQPPFEISADPVLDEDDEDKICFSVRFSSAFNLDELNSVLDSLSFDTGGNGWWEYIESYVSHHYPSLLDMLESDCENDVCSISTYSEANFMLLLKVMSSSIRELAKQVA